MKILAVLLIIISISKLTLSVISNHKDINMEFNCNMFDPEWVTNICLALIAGDGLIGLFCGSFILFMT